jgi:hypothetical protein
VRDIAKLAKASDGTARLPALPVYRVSQVRMGVSLDYLTMQDREKEKPAVAPDAAACMPVHMIKTEASGTQTLVTAQPFKVEVDSPTDLVAVLAVPLALAVAAGIFTLLSNRQQIKASTANYRHTWQLDLRNAIVDFLGAATELQVLSTGNMRFLVLPEAGPLRTQLLAARWKVEIMLDSRKSYAIELNAAMKAVVDLTFRLDEPDGSEVGSAMKRVSNASQVALEQAWQDIRRDLHSNKGPKNRGGENV